MSLVESGETEIPKYRKRSKKKYPGKADHKHKFVNCVYEIPKLRLDEARGFVCDRVELTVGTYCQLCGKIGTHFDLEWKEKEDKPLWNGWVVGEKWSARAEAEFNEQTRTLPFFRVNDMFKQKYVELEDEA